MAFVVYCMKCTFHAISDKDLVGSLTMRLDIARAMFTKVVFMFVFLECKETTGDAKWTAEPIRIHAQICTQTFRLGNTVVATLLTLPEMSLENITFFLINY